MRVANCRSCGFVATVVLLFPVCASAVKLPDLYVYGRSNSFSPLEVEQGGILTLDFAVANNGTMCIPGPCPEQFGAAYGPWDEAVFIRSRQTGESILLGTIPFTGILDPHETHEGLADFQIPSDCLPGRYQVVVHGDYVPDDPNGRVSETNEENNREWLKADLTIIHEAVTLYVDDDGACDPGAGDPNVSDPCENGSVEHPFDSIQEAIDAAYYGDEVRVLAGTYYETAAMKDGVDLAGSGADVTVIDAGGYSEIHGVVRAENIEDSNTTLSGFTLMNGPHGVSAENSKIIIEDNTIRNNGGQAGNIIYGAGIIVSDSVASIRNNNIRDNVEMGIWITGSHDEPEPDPSIIVNNVVANNGSGIIGSTYARASIKNNTISNNGVGISSRVGSSLLIANNIVTSNRVGIVKDNTSSAATSLYNDVWNNTEDDYRDISSGVGDISEDPCFADSDAGDYHLKSQAGRWDANEGRWVIDDVTSPCIDGGDPMSAVGAEAFPNGGVINMGAYGGTAKGSKSYFGGPPCEAIVAGDVNGDCIVDYRDFRLMALHWCEEW